MCLQSLRVWITVTFLDIGFRVSGFGVIARLNDGNLYVFLQSLRVWVSYFFGYRVSGFGLRVDRQAQSRDRVRVLAVPASSVQSPE